MPCKIIINPEPRRAKEAAKGEKSNTQLVESFLVVRGGEEVRERRNGAKLRLASWEGPETGSSHGKTAGFGLGISTIHVYTYGHAVLRSRRSFFGNSLLRVFGL